MSETTNQQRNAVTARGNVLVSAGAGTGKTTIVVERCLQLVLEEECTLENILMVTFTEAAAAGMRERIRAALRERARAAPAGSVLAERLAQEMALLDVAPICTLHSFCLDLVRQHFHLLGIDPQFAVLDEQQTGPLIHETLDALFQRHYADAAPHSGAVRELVRRYGGGSDEPIRRLVARVHRHTQALADPERWFASQTAAFANPKPTSWRNAFIAGVVDWAKLWHEAIEPYAALSTNVRRCAQALDELPPQPGFEEAARAVTAVVHAHEMKWDVLKKGFRDPIKPFFTEAAFLHELARDNGAPLVQDWEWSREQMLTLLQLTREFTESFTEVKRESGGVDFADQERLALRLLYDETGRPTPIANACRERFRFVFVDECQDINEAQDAILRAVSRENVKANRFLVGDVKQSIYRFRLADPRIFQNYESRWKETGGDGRFLPLSENFRGREALLHFINPLFRTLMRPVIGGLNYEADVALVFGNAAERMPLSLAARTPPAGAPANAWPRSDEVAPRVELHLIARETGESTDGEPEENESVPLELLDLESTEREARLIAQRLKQLEEQGYRVWDRELRRFKPVDYCDMVVLMRGIGTRAEAFAKAFHQAGVPLHAERAGFLEALEVTDLLNLLRLFDNPLQDVPLLAVLRSPLVGFSPEELARLRLADRHKLFWFALRRFHANGPAPGEIPVLWQKVDWFLRRWEAWRQIIRQSALSHCLETALAETHYEALVLSNERGPARLANVRRFVDLARSFDPYQRQGLFRFLRFIEEQREAEVRHEPAALATGNAVRLMTIHQSKGLEFPVVILAGVGNAFNFRDLQGDILLQEDFGLCPKVLPPGGRRRYPSVTHWLAAQRERRAVLGEEMRLLYVALTRARDTLILAGTARKKSDDALWTRRAPVTDRALVTARCYLDWLRLWLPHASGGQNRANEHEGGNDLLRWKVYDPLDPIFALSESNQFKPASNAAERAPTAEELTALRTRLEWRYPFGAATRQRSKTSYTAQRAVVIEEDDVVDFEPTLPGATRPLHRKSRGPGPSGKEIGRAHHKFLQFVRFDRLGGLSALKEERERLVSGNILSPEEASSLDLSALADFWRGELGTRIRTQKQERLHRELRFTVRLSPSDLNESGLPVDLSLSSCEFVVVQGAVDLAVILPKEIWLMDFKTDDLRDRDVDAKRADYGRQIKLYALALDRIYRRPVTESWLHFLALGKTMAL
jgi:ATP-dependent helicase/nuclease subunit A